MKMPMLLLFAGLLYFASQQKKPWIERNDYKPRPYAVHDKAWMDAEHSLHPPGREYLWQNKGN